MRGESPSGLLRVCCKPVYVISAPRCLWRRVGKAGAASNPPSPPLPLSPLVITRNPPLLQGSPSCRGSSTT